MFQSEFPVLDIVNREHSYSHLLKHPLGDPKLLQIFFWVLIFSPQSFMKMSKSLGLESSARPGKICCRRASFLSKTSIFGKRCNWTLDWIWQGSLLGIRTWQNKQGKKHFLPRSKWDVLQQTIYAPQIGFQDIPGHFQCSKLCLPSICLIQVCIEVKMLKHNPAQDYLWPKNY